MSDRQKVFLALLVSVLFHLGVVFLLSLWSGRQPETAAKARPDLSRLVVTIMPQKAAPSAQKPATLQPAKPSPPPINKLTPDIDSDGLATSAKPPAHPLFQSDSNMAAGSLLPATGNIPLPSEAGPDRKFKDFANRPASMGAGRVPSNPAKPRKTNPSAPEPKNNGAASPARLAAATPQPAPHVESRPTPAPARTPLPTPGPDILALGKPAPTAPPARSPTPVAELARLTLPPSLRAQAEMAPLSRPETASRPPVPSEPEPNTQRRMDRTRIDGGITEHGAPGVDAVETPFGRYHRKLSNLIGSRWQLYLQEHPKDVGDVTILVKLNTNGKVAGTRILANHAMDDLAELSTRAIMESDLPPIPDDLAPMLREGKLEITFNFNVYDPGNDSSGR